MCHEEVINHAHYLVCCSCGHHVPRKLCASPHRATAESWLPILENKLYAQVCNATHPQRHHFCQTCVNSLRRGKAPFGSLCRGWPFADTIPSELSCLSKYERQLICLHLPCIYVWRAQGGFGQYACKGSPVSFSNPVSQLAAKLPRFPSKVFHVFMENRTRVRIDSARVRGAIIWLKQHNPLYTEVQIDEDAFRDIEEVQQLSNRGTGTANGQTRSNQDVSMTEPREGADSQREANWQGSSVQNINCVETEEMSRGTPGPIDSEVLDHLYKNLMTGVEDTDNHYHAHLLIQHMLRPFSHRRNHLLPSYDAAEYLESYFPVLFPYGKGGAKSLQCQLGRWVKHALAVHRSRFATDIDFIFFLYSVLKRKRLTGLSACAPIRQRSTDIVEVRDMLNSDLPSQVLAKRIDLLL